MSTESQRAGMGAILAAAIGLIAVMAILVANRGGTSRDTVRGSSSEPGRGIEWSGPEDGTRGDGAREAVGGEDTEGGALEDREDEPGELALSGPRDAGAGPEGGIPREVSAVEPAVASAPAAPELPRRRRELTPEERYEAHAFLNDMVVLRIDNLRNEIAAAREAGDERTLRRLEPALEVLEEEAERLDGRRRELERALGRPGIGPVEGESAASPSDDPI